MENEAAVEAKEKEILSLDREVKALKDVCTSFGDSGVPSFVTEGALGDLTSRTETFMKQLLPGTTMNLTIVKKESTKKDSLASEKIDKVVEVKLVPLSYLLIQVLCMLLVLRVLSGLG